MRSRASASATSPRETWRPVRRRHSNVATQRCCSPPSSRASCRTGSWTASSTATRFPTRSIPPLALLLGAAWCAIVTRRFRILFATVFIGAVLPDLVDLGPAVANRLLGWHLPTFRSHLFPWHWVDGSGSLYPLEGAPARAGHGDLDAGDNQMVSATNHAIVLFLSIAAIVSNRQPFRSRATR